MVGEELISVAQRRENQRGKLILLSEYEAPDILFLSAFFTKLTNDVNLLECNTFYTLTRECQGKDHPGYTEKFQEFMYEKGIGVRLEEAPWEDNPGLGLDYINEWMKKGLLQLPEGSLVLNQLRMVVGEKVNQLSETLNAVNALRFVVCGFEKYKPNPTLDNWRDKIPKGSWRVT